MKQTRLCYIINHAAFFVSHRLPLAAGAIEQGYLVHLLTGQAGSVSMEQAAVQKLSNYSIVHERVDFSSASVNPFKEALGLIQLCLKLRKLNPEIVHCASPKGLLYGGIAARLTGVPCLVLAVSGMGYAFTQGSGASPARRLIGFIYRSLAKFAFNHKNLRVIVQNSDDQAMLVASDLVDAEDIELIPGSGVDLAEFPEASASARENRVLFPARVLYDKGIREFVQAASKVRTQYPDWKFVIAGAADYDNPSAAPRSHIEGWVNEGLIDWLGHVDKMPEVYQKAKIVCLPSYREGMPKALLEAAAAGCAVVTTDVTGCREAIVNGQTGDLVPVRDSDALAEALLALIRDDERRQRYGEYGRLRAIERFSLDSVVNTTLKIYQDLGKNVRSGK